MQVKEAATIGVVDSTWGQRPLMFIVLQPGAHVGTSDIAEHLTVCLTMVAAGMGCIIVDL